MQEVMGGGGTRVAGTAGRGREATEPLSLIQGLEGLTQHLLTESAAGVLCLVLVQVTHFGDAPGRTISLV